MRRYDVILIYDVIKRPWHHTSPAVSFKLKKKIKEIQTSLLEIRMRKKLDRKRDRFIMTINACKIQKKKTNTAFFG